MASSVQVVADGTEGEQSQPPSSPSWVMLLVGLVLGLGLGSVFFMPLGLERTEVTAPEADEPVANPVVAPEGIGRGLAEEVTGFSDALVVVTETQTDSLEYLIWPRDGAVVTHPMFGGDAIEFDVRAQHVAVVQQVAGESGFLLATGRFNSVRPFASGASSFAWHDSEPGHLAYTTSDEEGTRLWTVTQFLNPQEVTSDLVNGSRVVAWGEWGFALQVPDDQIVLFTADGELKAVREGMVFASTPRGWLFVVGEQAKLLSAGGGMRGLSVSSQSIDGIRAAAFSHSGELLAVAGAERTLVYSLSGDGDAAVASFATTTGGPLRWTPDDRFIVTPARNGVLVLDLGTGTRTLVLENRIPVAVGVLAGSDS